MIQIAAHFRVEDFTRFLGVFATRGQEQRTRHGCRGAQVFRVAGDPCMVMAVFDWESREAFDGFRNDPETRETMKASGTMPPQFEFLERIAILPG